jgi:ComF family protein
MKRLLADLMDGIFPPRCVECKHIGAYLCLEHKALAPAEAQTRNMNALDEIVSGVEYDQDRAKKLVDYFKYKGHTGIARVMVEHVHLTPEQCTWTLVPVPLHWTRKIWRGFNQAEAMCRAFEEKYAGMQTKKGLVRTQKTQQQATLNKAQRQANIATAFAWTTGIVPKKILLVDDVVTTGSTLDAAAAALKQAGATHVVGVTFASTGVLRLDEPV